MEKNFDVFEGIWGVLNFWKRWLKKKLVGCRVGAAMHAAGTRVSRPSTAGVQCAHARQAPLALGALWCAVGAVTFPFVAVSFFYFFSLFLVFLE